jgi:hypothetical protein
MWQQGQVFKLEAKVWTGALEEEWTRMLGKQHMRQLRKLLSQLAPTAT